MEIYLKVNVFSSIVVFLLKTPQPIEAVGNQVSHLYNAFREKSRCIYRPLAGTFNVDVIPWGQNALSELRRDSRFIPLPNQEDHAILYSASSSLISKIENSVQDLGIDIWLEYNTEFGKDYFNAISITRVLNLGVIRDISKGILFPDPMKTYCIGSVHIRPKNLGTYWWHESVHNEWVAFRDSAFNEIQRRINASVSAAAYHIVTDLHQ